MTANLYGPVDKVSKSGDTMTGTLTMQGSPPINVPGGAAGKVLTSDASGNITLQPRRQSDAAAARHCRDHRPTPPSPPIS